MSAKIILMADNLGDFLEERREFLEQAGYTVVTADNPGDSEKILERGGIDLAILDIRLIDDNDPEDTSGLELARKFGQNIPIIMLTGYPTWENVKAALGSDLNNLNPAVDFLSKEEGPDLMIQAVNLTVEQPRLKMNVLHEFEAESSQAMHESVRKNEPGETTDKFQKSLERTERDLLQHRKEISQQSERFQKTAIWMGLVGMGVILIGAFLAFIKITPLAVLSGAASIISEATSVLFITRAVQASRQVDKNYAELQEIYKASHLISICDTIENKAKREDTKIMILEKLAGKWMS
jgi:CheY-like chemotaxis protein